MARFAFKSTIGECARQYFAWSPARLKSRRRRQNAKSRTGKDAIAAECLENRRLLTATASVPTVNHAPVGTSGTVIDVTNTPYTFTASTFGFTDPNDSPPNAFLAAKITLLPTAGKLADNGTPVNVNQFVSVADINAGKLIFTPNSNLSGGPFFLCKFQVQDNGGTANGGTNLDPNAKILDIKLKQPNHAPTGKSATLNTPVNKPYVFQVSDFGFSDANDHPPDAFLAVKIDILPTAGKITDNGTPVTAGQFVSAADIAAGALIFTPQANLKGGPFFLCKFQVEDNGGTGGGGNNLDPTAKVLYIDLFLPAH